MQVQLAISNSTNNNYTGHDGIHIRHLKHLGHLPSDTSQAYTKLPSTPTQYYILENVSQSFSFLIQKNIGTNY